MMNIFSDTVIQNSVMDTYLGNFLTSISQGNLKRIHFYLTSRRSEGLQTVRALAPIPNHAMQWTPGFPTKV